MSQPEDLKKGLECCFSGRMDRCEGCPYRGLYFCNTIMGTNALALIRHLEAQVPRWISVKERLPETIGGCSQNVNVYTIAGEVLPGWCTKGQWYVIGKNDDYCSPVRDFEITHWMPPPKPPKDTEK